MVSFFKQISKNTPLLKPIGIITIFAFCVSFTLTVLPETQKTIIYFHSSETNINNFKSLKINFDRYLSKYGRYEFQPIKNRTAFEKQIHQGSRAMLILSSWHYQMLHKKYALIPILVGTYNGKSTQKRILVTRKTTTQKPQQGNTVASASSETYTRTVLSEMAARPDVKILTVPKDIDALFAAGFGVCEFAVTTEQSFKKLREVSPDICGNLKIIESYKESFLLIVAATTGENEVSNVIRQMADTPEGKKNLRMLGLDNWKNITSFDRAKLEQESDKAVSRVNK